MAFSRAAGVAISVLALLALSVAFEAPACGAAEEEAGDGSCLLQHRSSASANISRHGRWEAAPLGAARQLASDVRLGAMEKMRRGRLAEEATPFKVWVKYDGVADWKLPSSSYSYSQCPYCADTSDPVCCLGRATSWMTDSGKHFNFLQTSQYWVTMKPDPSRPTHIKIDDQRTGGAVPCARLFIGETPIDVQLGIGETDISGFWDNRADGEHDPLHITVIPFTSKTAAPGPYSCTADDIAEFDESSVAAVYLSVWDHKDCDTTAEWCCDMGQNWPTGAAVNDGSPCSVVHDSFEHETDGANHWLIYKGTLTQMMMDLDTYYPWLGQLRIWVPTETNLWYPLNNMIMRMTIDSSIAGNVDACKAWTTKGGDCYVTDVEEYTYEFKKKIVIEGLGRITAWMWVGLYRYDDFEAGHVPFYDKDSAPTAPKRRLAEDIAYVSTWDNLWHWFNEEEPKGIAFDTDKFQRYPSPVQYRVLSGSMVLSSSKGPAKCGDDYAMDISGVQVGFGPKRGAGATQFNSQFTPAIYYPYETTSISPDRNNFCSKLFDVKVVGNWIDASDGPENLGQRSLTKFAYLHVNDDSIKVATNELHTEDVTILQGNVGAAVMVGAFGKNRGVDDAYITRTWVLRITHNCLETSCGGYDGNNGAIATRGCPVTTMTENGWNAGLRRATVDYMKIMELQDINTVQALFVLGIDGTLQGNVNFCDKEKFTNSNTGPYIIEDIKLLNVASYVNPARVSRILNKPGGALVSWGNPDPNLSPLALWFFDGSFSGPFPNQPTAMYTYGPNPDHGGAWEQMYYYVCATCLSDDPACAGDQTNCYNSFGSDPANHPASKNTNLDGDLQDSYSQKDVYWTLKFPLNGGTP